MKRSILFLLVAALFPVIVFGQTAKPTPLPVRQISGLVTDSADNGIRGALIKLISKSDTLTTHSNDDGLFFFKDVKSSEFTLSVSSLGYRTFVKIGKYNDSNSRITLDQIILRTSSLMLPEVVIKEGPSIVYKEDTVEYQASDYVVRENANVGELLSKMDGMVVGNDGSLYYNGAEVTKAKLNGKEFLAGDVPTVAKNIPAEIIEKVQIINDYGDQAARTGIKDGSPKIALNITTRLDRSIGYFAKLAGGAGNDQRYEGDILGTKINANRNYTLSVSTSNTINGISAAPGAGFGSGVSGGNTKRQGAIISYRDEWGRKTQANINYSYNSADVNSLKSSVSQNFSPNGTTFSTNESNAFNNANYHTLRAEIETDLDSSNYIKLTPSFSYNTGNTENTASNLLTGLIHQNQNSAAINANRVSNYGLGVFFQHLFYEARRNFSFFLSGSKGDNGSENEQNTNITYFDILTNAVLKDSLVSRLVNRDNLAGNYTGNFTYTHPIGNPLKRSYLSFGAQTNYNSYNNRATTSSISAGAVPLLIDSLSNIFKYSFVQTKLALRYQLSSGKYNFTTGFATIPTFLSGESPSLKTSVRQSSFNVMPIFQFRYSRGAGHSISLNYTGDIMPPSFDQVQPVKDVSDPQNTVVGNPALKLALNHGLNVNFDSYYPNSRFGFNAGLSGNIYQNRVITNIVQVADAYNSIKYERHFLNIDGSYRIGGNYSVSKALTNRKYSFAFSGTIDRRYTTGINNNQRNASAQWVFTEKLGSRITPVSSLEINPSVSYNYSSSNNSLPAAADSKIKIWSANLDGRYYNPHSWWVRYSAVKYFVEGINANLINDPMVVNLSFGIDLTKKKDVSVSLWAFDLFNQNKNLNRSITENSITDTRSNSMSRYFMGNLSFNLQRWKGTPQRNGITRARRGDGSFTY